MQANDVNPFGETAKAPIPKPAHKGLEGSKHHYLVAGEVFVMEGDSVGSIKLNAIVLTDANRITALDIGKAQQSLQRHLFERRKLGQDSDDIKIVDVFIFGFSYLGHMKPSSFTNLPKEA